MIGFHGNISSKKRMLKNLDVLAYQSFSEEKLKEAPTLQRAEKQLAELMVRDPQNQQYSLCCDLSQFKKYGPGVYLAFYLLKNLLVVMGCLFIFPLVNMIVQILAEEQFVSANVQTILETTTMSSLEGPNGLVIAFNFIVLVVLTIGVMYWRSIQDDLVMQCTKASLLSSYFTAVLTKIPNYYRQQDLKQYLQKHYGDVQQIYTSKNYGDDLIHYQKMCQIVKDIKQKRQIYLKTKAKAQFLSFIKLFENYRNLHQELTEFIAENKVYEPFCAFVTFETEQARNKLLQDHSIKFKKIWKGKNKVAKSQVKLYKDQELQFQACEMEPDGIAWQNLYLSPRQKTIRWCIILLLLTFFLFFVMSLFFILAAASSSLYTDEYDHWSQQQILKSSNPEVIRSFCLQLGLAKFHQYKECSPFLNDYISYFSLYLVFPFVIVILKLCFGVLMQRLVALRRHKYEVHKIQWEISLMTLFYFIKAGLIKWFIGMRFHVFGCSFELLTAFLPFLNQVAKIMPISPDKMPVYEDFGPDQVAHTSHKIILIGLLSFNFSILLHYFGKCILKRWKLGKAAQKKVQLQMNQQLKGFSFDLEFIYSEILSLFLFCMLYFACMPIIYLFVYVSLFLLYWIVKYKFVRMDRRPPVYAHAINDLAVKIIVIGLTINSVVSPLYYGAQDSKSSSSWLQRMTIYWYYLVVFLFLLLFGLLRVQKSKLFTSFKHYVLQHCLKKGVKKINQSKFNIMNIGAKKLQSYSMHNHPEYAQLLRVLYLINHNEMNHDSYFCHKSIAQIKSQIQRERHQFFLYNWLFKELEVIISQNQGGNTILDLSEFNEQLIKLKLLKQEVQKQIEQDIKWADIYEKIKKRMIQLSNLSQSDKIQSQLNQKESNDEQELQELQYSSHFQGHGVQTDIRLSSQS